MNRALRLRIFRQLRLIQPRRRAFDAHAVTGQQVGDKTLAQFQIAQGITARRVEQARAETQLAAGGDRGCDLQPGSDVARHDIHPAEATQQRHHGAAVFGHGEYRRLGALFQQQRRQRTDDDAGRAQSNDRRVLLIQRTQGRAELLIGAIGAFDAPGEAVDLRRRIDLLNAPCGGQATLAENDDGWRRLSHQPCHRSPGTMISEKYGDDIGST
ncbi:hypothetical protein D3C81_1430460 [compost metagenome]